MTIQNTTDDQRYEFTLRAVSRFETADEFENMTVAVGEGGNPIKLKDIGRAELGAENYDTSVKFNF